MARKSTIKALPDDVRGAIDSLLKDGRATIEDLVTYCGEAGHTISRSAMGRYKVDFDKVGEKLRQSREMANALVAQIGPNMVEGKTGRLLVEILQSITFDHLLKQKEEDAGAEPMDVMLLAKALKDMASTQKISADHELRVRREMAKEAADAVEKTARAEGLSKSTIASYRRAILGVANK